MSEAWKNSNKVNIICDPSIYTMDHPDYIKKSFMRDSIRQKRVYLILLILSFSVTSNEATNAVVVRFEKQQ